MAALEWDKTGERRWENGVDHGVLYVEASTYDPLGEQDIKYVVDSEEIALTNNDLKLNGTFYKGVAWNGLTGVTESPDGAEPTDLWADNIKYASLRSAETFGATIEAYTYPEEFTECDGGKEPVPGLRLGQQVRKPFGFAFRTNVGNDTATESDDGYKIHVIYNATASPSERAYETVNDSPDAITFSWEVTTTPINLTGYKPVSTIVIDSTKFTTAEQKATLAVVEGILFGCSSYMDGNIAITTDVAPCLPSPDMLLKLLGGAFFFNA